MPKRALHQKLHRRSPWTIPERGSELVEAGFVVPLLLTFLIGIFWIARAYNAYETMRRAAREGARFAVAPDCALCGSGNDYPTDDEVRAVIDSALQADNLDPSQVIPNPITILRGQALNPGGTVVETGVVIDFSYPFEIFLPFTPVQLTTLNLNVHVQMREEK